MEVIVKIEFGESVKNLFADLFKLVGQQPAVVVNNLPVSDGVEQEGNYNIDSLLKIALVLGIHLKF